jgi:hypothetical protein
MAIFFLLLFSNVEDKFYNSLELIEGTIINWKIRLRSLNFRQRINKEVR